MLPCERETIINWNDEEDYAVVYSCHRTIWTKMRKLGIKPVRVEKGDGKEYKIPKSWIKINKPKKRKFSKKHLENLRERMRQIGKKHSKTQ